MSRREFLSLLALSASALAVSSVPLLAEVTAVSPRGKSKSAKGRRIPRIGMGTWITFNVGDDPALRAARVEVLREFFRAGGGLIDSSPMYGSAEAVVGHALAALGYPETLISATKVWTPSTREGVKQIHDSHQLWGLKTFDLFQVHNLVNWQAHLKTLFDMKARGALRYVGITTSHGRRHDEMAKIMRSEPIDFVQLTYNLIDRSAEPLLELAAEREIGVIVNRPFDGGDLFQRVEGKPLPPWAASFDCQNWAQFFLKYIVSHPAVTCAIPATSKIEHMRENMGAAKGRLPDAATREKMLAHFSSL
jgi:diketogulonate reductase-like aldo/keto reductase